MSGITDEPTIFRSIGVSANITGPRNAPSRVCTGNDAASNHHIPHLLYSQSGMQRENWSFSSRFKDFLGELYHGYLYGRENSKTCQFRCRKKTEVGVEHDG